MGEPVTHTALARRYSPGHEAAAAHFRLRRMQEVLARDPGLEVWQLVVERFGVSREEAIKALAAVRRTRQVDSAPASR